MNINQVSKLFSDVNSQEVRTLELRVGQVVRGVVTAQLPNQEALVNINGVQVKAKLEVPILEGQATLMQVAPDSKGNFIHLKQVDPISLGLQDPMKDIIKSMNLPDKEWSNQLVRELRQEGFPLNRETLQALAQAVKEKPPHVDLEGWMQAATQAFKRGMPMTAASISAMHQLTQGTPLHQLVSQLQQQLTQLIQPQAGQLSSQSVQLLQQLTQSLNQLVNGQGLQANQAQGQALQANQAQGQGQATQVGLLAQAQGQLANPNQSQQAQPAQVQNPIASFMKLLGVQHENMISQQLLKPEQTQTGQTQLQANTLSQQVNPQAQQQSAGTTSMANAGQPVSTFNGLLQPSGSANQAVAQMQTAASQAHQQGGQSSASALSTATNSVNQAQQTITQQVTNQSGSTIISQQSVSSEQQLPSSQQVATQQASSQVQPSNQQVIANGQSQSPAQQMTSTAASGQGSVQATMLHNQADPIQAQPSQIINNSLSQTTESIKATVLSLLQMTDVPAAMKESLGQLLNHITGQQMMLAAERNPSMFTHITMFIPIKDDQGGQTAAVHVQTRRDRKGQLDAENCRIVFDLNMKQLGQTLVDMNVTNKIVSLNVWNDSSFIQNLLDSMRPEIFEAMKKTGYSLSSIKALPFKKEEQDMIDEVKAIIQPPAMQHMNASRYKGVDFKI